MLLTVPEGEYEVYISHSGIEGTKQVSIKRNEETKLDVSDLKKEDLIKYGNLIITVDPSSAEVYIDGKRVDISRIIKASYGIHQLMVKAEGYDTIIQYIRVQDSSANIAVSLDEETVHTISGNSVNKDTGVTDNKNSSSENNTVSGKSTSANTGTTENNTSSNVGTTGYKVTVEAPEGAELYVDGNYVGIIPASFAKKPGTHDVTIRKSGYKTRSYTVDVDDENKDINFSFSELTKTE